MWDSVYSTVGLKGLIETQRSLSRARCLSVANVINGDDDIATVRATPGDPEVALFPCEL